MAFSARLLVDCLVEIVQFIFPIWVCEEAFTKGYMKIDQYYYSVCYFDFGRFYPDSEAVSAMFRKATISAFDERKRGMAEVYKDAKEMFGDMNKSAQKSFTEYYGLFVESKTSFKADKTKVTVAGNLQEYFHLLLRSGELYADKTAEQTFHALNRIILDTDVRMLHPVDPRSIDAGR